MKKQSCFMNEHGFILPSVSFIIFILFIVFLTNLTIYKQEIEMNHYAVERLKAESLMNLGVKSFQRDILEKEGIPSTMSYTFPQGRVSLTSHPQKLEGSIVLNLKVETDKQEQYGFVLTISSPNH